jgi:hypothetical protein
MGRQSDLASGKRIGCRNSVRSAAARTGRTSAGGAAARRPEGPTAGRWRSGATNGRDDAQGRTERQGRPERHGRSETRRRGGRADRHPESACGSTAGHRSSTLGQTPPTPVIPRTIDGGRRTRRTANPAPTVRTARATTQNPQEKEWTQISGFRSSEVTSTRYEVPSHLDNRSTARRPARAPLSHKLRNF